MTSTQDVETLFTNNNSFQNFSHLNDHTIRTVIFFGHIFPEVVSEKKIIGIYFFIGKRVDTIQKQWQQIFVEAAWHQPSVILFDDLDQVVSAPSALQEMGGEALYKRRLAQGEMPLMHVTHI